MVRGSLALKVHKDGTIDGFEPHLKCNTNTNNDKKCLNIISSPINNPINNIQSSSSSSSSSLSKPMVIQMNNISRIDSDYNNNDIIMKDSNIFNNDDVKRIMRVLHENDSNNLIEDLYILGLSNQSKLLALEESLNDIKQIILKGK